MVSEAPRPALNTQVLDTKFFPPRSRIGTVGRTRLVDRLARGAASKLTLISAPAGFGKTTLLAEWLAASRGNPHNVAWLSLDSSDSDPVLFWAHVVAAIQTVATSICAGASALLQLPQPPPLSLILPTLLNELGALEKDLVLVLDDFHVVESCEVHASFALDQRPLD